MNAIERKQAVESLIQVATQLAKEDPGCVGKVVEAPDRTDQWFVLASDMTTLGRITDPPWQGLHHWAESKCPGEAVETECIPEAAIADGTWLSIPAPPKTIPPDKRLKRGIIEPKMGERFVARNGSFVAVESHRFGVAMGWHGGRRWTWEPVEHPEPKYKVGEWLVEGGDSAFTGHITALKWSAAEEWKYAVQWPDCTTWWHESDILGRLLRIPPRPDLPADCDCELIEECREFDMEKDWGWVSRDGVGRDEDGDFLVIHNVSSCQHPDHPEWGTRVWIVRKKAAPALTGVPWLEANWRPGMALDFRGERFVTTTNSEGTDLLLPATRDNDFAYRENGQWDDLHACFKGHENELSDKTVTILPEGGPA